MRGLLILPESERLIAGVHDDLTLTSAQARNLAADYLRWPRWFLGVAAWAIALPSTFYLIPAIVAATQGWGGNEVVVVIVLGVVGLAISVPVALLLRATGSALSRTARRLGRHDYESGREARDPLTNAYQRARLYAPAMFVRLTSATVAILVGVLGLTAVFMPEASIVFLAGIVPASVVSLIFGVCQFRGAQNIYRSGTT